ncbi:MAG: glycosyltransferase family 4 protein [Chloroflexota bacterium]
MKVGLVIYGDLNTLSGGYLYDRKLVNYLQNQGDEVEIISLPWRNYPSHWLHNFSTPLRERLRGLQVDVLLQDELNHPSLFFLNHSLRKDRNHSIVSIVHHLRCMEEHPRVFKWLYRQVEQRYLNSVDGFIFNSRTTLQSVSKMLKTEKPAVIATPGGDALSAEWVDLQNDAHSRKDGLHFIFVGNWIPRKGLHTLLIALHDLQSFDWKLSLVGRTNLQSSYEKRIRRLIESGGLSHRVRIYGAISDGDLVKTWQSADVLVVPSQYEGFGIVYLEAMRFGVIPVAGQAGAASEIIQSGVNGFLVPPESPAALKKVLLELLSDADLRVALSKAARRRYEEFPTWQESMATARRFLIEHFLY